MQNALSVSTQIDSTSRKEVMHGMTSGRAVPPLVHFSGLTYGYDPCSSAEESGKSEMSSPRVLARFLIALHVLLNTGNCFLDSIRL